MELVKNIFFNTDRLTSNSIVKISYTGKFFQDGSKEVLIHYGFGNEWTDLTDCEMVKTDLGFQTEINLIDSETFNFCFNNGDNEWDNNNGQNYIFTLEHPDLNLVALENSLPSPRRLRRSYLINKKIRIAVYKMLIYIPRLITGKYKRKRHTKEC